MSLTSAVESNTRSLSSLASASLTVLSTESPVSSDPSAPNQPTTLSQMIPNSATGAVSSTISSSESSPSTTSNAPHSTSKPGFSKILLIYIFVIVVWLISVTIFVIWKIRQVRRKGQNSGQYIAEKLKKNHPAVSIEAAAKGVAKRRYKQINKHRIVAQKKEKKKNKKPVPSVQTVPTKLEKKTEIKKIEEELLESECIICLGKMKQNSSGGQGTNNVNTSTGEGNANHDTEFEDIELGDIDIDTEEQKPVRVLPCDHLFHDECILHWIEQNPTCPVCSKRLV